MVLDDRPSPFERLSGFVLHHRLLCAAFFALSTAVLLSGLPGLRIDNSLESLFPEGDGRLASLNAAIREYGTETGVVIALRPPEVFDNGFLEALDRITRKIGEVGAVSKVVSLTSIDQIRAAGEEIRIVPLIPGIPVSPERMASIRSHAGGDPMVVGQILSADGSTAAVAVQLATVPDDESPAGATLDEIAALLDEEVSGRFEYHMSGIVVLFTAMNQYSVRDLKIFIPAGILIVTILLALVYRTLSGVLVTLGATLLSVLWTLGLMGLCRVPITVGTTMLPVLIMVISVSDAVHLISQYYEALAEGGGRRRALEVAIYKVGTPCFLTSLTTAIGFSSLLLSGLRPVRDLGLFAAAGIFFAFLIFIFLVPVVLSCLEPPPRHAAGRLNEGPLARLMAIIAGMTTRHPRKILWTAGLVMALGVS
ncbi:RND family transporter, partial [Thermodesulfobacteriota bacterium]